MIRHFRTALTAAMLGTVALGGWAADAEPTKEPLSTDAREVKQDARIQEGVDKGQVTTYEAKRLKVEQKGIAKYEKRTEADGKVTRKEQNRLQTMQNKASKDIHRQRHDKMQRE